MWSAVCPPAPETPEVAVALDGKTLRGSKKQGAPGTHLLSALAHHVGVTLAQYAVDDKTNEITAVETLLRQLVLEGRIVTMDALLTQRHVAQTIVDQGGDYVMIVKDNQPQLRADIELVFALPPGATSKRPPTRWIGGMGASSSALSPRVRPDGLQRRGPGWPRFSSWAPGHEQKNGQGTVEVVYGVTSLSSERATPERLFELCGGSGRLRTARIGSGM